ncbi:hypothetical protein [Paludisphaera rhizosphaerae]|uniref:hypothetical protein n=1 Tax=Paludisphaera rhizosphaerae TaxID=2711216 RepID=UPI0013EB5576|nr:hypothetical protein [Paludisphaera rhizosphaerae]
MSKFEMVLAVVAFVIFGLSVTGYARFARKHYSAYLPAGHRIKGYIFASIILDIVIFISTYVAMFHGDKSLKTICFLLIVNYICLIQFTSVQRIVLAYVFGGQAVIELARRMTAQKNQGELDIEEINPP